MKRLVFKHYLKRSLKEPVGIAILTGLPTLLIIIFSMVLTAQYEESVYMFQGYNMLSTHVAIMFMVTFQFFGGNALLDYLYSDFRGDRRWRMFSMPVKTNDYVAGSLAACIIYCLVQGLVIIGISALFLDVHWGNPFVLIATLIACSILSQLIWMLLFLLIPKKGTVEVAGQIVIWGMMIASGWIGMDMGGAEFHSFLSQYGTPISLARNAISSAGHFGTSANSPYVYLGMLYGVLLIMAVVVAAVGKNKGFSTAKNTIAASPASIPVKGLKTADKVIQDAVDISKQGDLEIAAPTDRSGGQFTIYKYALLRACRNPLSLIFNAVLPVALILIPGLWSGESAMGFSFIGVAIMYGSFVAARGILSDKLDGTLTRILSSRVSSIKYLVQNLFAAMTPLTLQILAVGALGHTLHEWSIGFTLSLMLLYFLFAAASVAFSFAWSCLFKEKETSYAIFSVLMSVVAMLGGFFMPLQILPNALRFIGALFPAFWTSNGILYLRGDMVNSMGTYWTSAAAIFLFAVLYMVFGGKRRMI